MKTLLKIAFRNLREHRSKTLIIGVIMAAGVTILVVGNALIDTAGSGIKKAFIDNFTGDVFIHGLSDKGNVNLFFVEAPGQTVETPTLPQYARIVAFIDTLPSVMGFTSQITGFATLALEGETAEEQVFTLLFGVDGDSYHTLFTNTRIVEGRYLLGDEEGIVLPLERMEQLEEQYGRALAIGDPILINGFGSVGYKIREVPIIGVYEVIQETEGSSPISYVDAQTARALKGLNVTVAGEVVLTEGETILLQMDVEGGGEDLFSNELFGSDMIDESDIDEISEEDLLAILTEPDEAANDNSERVLAETTEADATPSTIARDSGAWEYVLLQMKNETWTRVAIGRLNSFFSEHAIQARADGWKEAAGPFSTSADVVRIVFTAAVFMVAVVAVLIIMNTLVLSVIERTSEIGTMRALGSQKSFIRRLFTSEIIIITLLFGTIGIAAGVTLLGIVTLIGIKATNPLLEVLFAGPVLRPVISVRSLLLTEAGVLILGIVANLYPLRLALKVQPVEAISAE